MRSAPCFAAVLLYENFSPNGSDSISVMAASIEFMGGGVRMV